MVHGFRVQFRAYGFRVCCLRVEFRVSDLRVWVDFKVFLVLGLNLELTVLGCFRIFWIIFRI